MEESSTQYLPCKLPPLSTVLKLLHKMATLLDILLSWYISAPTCNIDRHENMQEKYVNIRANWKDMQHDYVACLHG